MVRLVTFGGLKIWLFIEQLQHHKQDRTLTELPLFICYFKFSEPTVTLYGVLICDPGSKSPKVFKTAKAAEAYAHNYLGERYKLNQ